MNRGERGPTGDHGQDGQAGRTGDIGRRGERGVEGPAGPARFLSRTATLTLFVFIVLSFALLAWRSEVNAHEIRVAQWQSCIGGVQILDRFNEHQRQLAELEREVAPAINEISPGLAEKRIEIYESGRFLPLRDCGPRP